MKKLLLVLFGSIATLTGNTQIVNGNFENWTLNSWEDPDTAQSSNSEMVANSLPANVTKVTPAQNGNFAVKLETNITAGDTNFAYVLFGSFGDNGPEGGFPYTQKPATLNGYYKSGIVSGDSAGILVAFRKGGTNITMDLFKFATSQSSYTAFSIPLSIATYSVNPDSVVLVAVSSLPKDFTSSATPKHGTWIILDNLTFGGSGITQQVPNTNFEVWKNISVESPQAWANYNTEAYMHLNKKTYADKTTDKYKGNYALKLTTLYVDSTNSLASVTNGMTTDSGYVGGVPFTNQIDTLMGYYKYIPSGADTAAIGLEFKKSGSSIYYTGKWLLPASSYTYFEIPIFLGQTPDSVRIDIASSNWPTPPSANGSVLYIDEIQWKSAPLNTGISNWSSNIFRHRSFPNPARNHIDITLELEEAASLELFIYDLNGKQVYRSAGDQYPQGKNVIRINTSNLASGNYLYSISSEDQNMGSGKFVVE